MYDRQFFRTTLGRASIVSMVMMTVFVIMSSQIAVTAPVPMTASIEQIEIA